MGVAQPEQALHVGGRTTHGILESNGGASGEAVWTPHSPLDGLHDRVNHPGTPMTPPPARGPEAVEQALLTAAIRRYARGARFSARTIATEAGVNSGQIQHRFGGMTGLRKAMLEELASRQRATLEGVTAAPLPTLLRRALDLQLADPTFVRVLARQLVEHPHEVAQESFPVVQRLRAALERDDTPQLRALMALGLCAALGLAFFGPWVAKALALSPTERAALADQLGALMLGALDGI